MSDSAEKIQSELYRTYRLSSSLTYYVKTRVRPLGWMLLFIFPVLVIFIDAYSKMTSFFLMSVVLSLGLVSLLFVFLRRRKCSVSGELPSIATFGNQMSYLVNVKNTGSSKLSGALLLDEEPDPRPKKSEFIKSREPGEEERNGFDRVFGYYRWLWVCKKKRQRKTKPYLLDSIKSGDSTTLMMACTPLKRGVMHFATMKLILPDPLGVFQKMYEAEQPEDHVVVLPKRYRLPELELSGTSRNQMGGEVASQSAGQVGEFIGLRDYKPGDPLKLIHWRSYAKTGKPIVKEYEDVFFPRCGLVLDTCCPFQELDKFEEAVSIAASFASSIDTKESLLDLIFLNQGAKVQTVGKGVAKIEYMLETLASVEVDLAPDWQSLTKKVLMHAEQLSSCVVILTSISIEKKGMVHKWLSSGMELLVIVLCATDDEISAAQSLGYTAISVQNVERDLQRMSV